MKCSVIRSFRAAKVRAMYRWPVCRWPVSAMAAAVLLLSVAWGPLTAQQVQLSAPQVGVNDSYYERFGTSWGFRSGNAFFNFGGPNPGLPPFGGHDPNAGARFGFGGRWGGGSFSLRGFAGQGSSRTLVSEVPTLVVPHGGIGSLANGLQRPFVTGLVPVVGQRSISPLLERLERLERLRRQPPRAAAGGASETDRSAPAVGRDEQPAVAEPSGSRRDPQGSPGRRVDAVADRSTAARGDLSVAEIRRRRTEREDAEREREQAEVRALVERGRGCEQAGKLGAAAIYYKQAARRAESPLREQLLEHAGRLRR